MIGPAQASASTPETIAIIPIDHDLHNLLSILGRPRARIEIAAQ
jgi:hypothetical protein